MRCGSRQQRPGLLGWQLAAMVVAQPNSNPNTGTIATKKSNLKFVLRNNRKSEPFAVTNTLKKVTIINNNFSQDDEVGEGDDVRLAVQVSRIICSYYIASGGGELAIWLFQNKETPPKCVRVCEKLSFTSFLPFLNKSRSTAEKSSIPFPASRLSFLYSYIGGLLHLSKFVCTLEWPPSRPYHLSSRLVAIVVFPTRKCSYLLARQQLLLMMRFM